MKLFSKNFKNKVKSHFSGVNIQVVILAGLVILILLEVGGNL